MTKKMIAVLVLVSAVVTGAIAKDYSIRVHDNYKFECSGEAKLKDGIYQIDENEVITCTAENGDKLIAGVLMVVEHGASGFTYDGKTYTGETDVYDVVYTEGHGFWIGRE